MRGMSQTVCTGVPSALSFVYPVMHYPTVGQSLCFVDFFPLIREDSGDLPHSERFHEVPAANVSSDLSPKD